MKAKLRKKVREEIEKISKKYFPNEGCALLIGKKQNEVIDIKRAIEAENVLDSPISFKMDPILVAETIEEIGDEKNKELVGFFHSHPNLTAFVSSLDRKCMELWPEKLWIIAGTDNKGRLTEIKSFKWEEQPVEVKLTNY